MQTQREQRLAILGTRGIPARYGGFETFAEQLSLHLVAKGWKVTVYCQVDTPEEAGDAEWMGVRLVRIHASSAGPAGTMWFDWLAVLRAAREGGLVLTLGYNTAVFLFWLRLRGVTTLINMDGLEWRRSKWGPLAKLWLYLNERVAPWFTSHLIADNPHIKAHLERNTPGERITMIPYGSVVVGEAEASHLERLGLEHDGYALIVARPEPENSILEMMQAFTMRRRRVKLVVLGRYYEELPYHAEVLKLARQHPDQVCMLGPIYEHDVLHALRLHARVYLHGHQVGGTNPSLVEALGAGNACVLNDNPFNRWVAGEAGEYFSTAEDCSALLDRLLDDHAALLRLREAAHERHRGRFMLEGVLNEYEQLLTAWSEPVAAAGPAIVQPAPTVD
jgi:glycosyltransferase involved in cell wall biosynthesis